MFQRNIEKTNYLRLLCNKAVAYFYEKTSTAKYRVKLQKRNLLMRYKYKKN